MLAEFIDKLSSGSVRVYPPTKRVLLCGGNVSKVIEPEYETVMKSLRDSCLRSRFSENIKDFPKFEFLQIEEIHEFFNKDCPYFDLLEFEKDMAQICELVLLITEGAGSFVELGSFSIIDEIKEKLLLVIRRKFVGAESYIARGPVAALRKAHPNSVAVLSDAVVGIEGENFSKIDPYKFGNFLRSPLDVRIKESAERTTLDVSKFNHACKFYAGILREFYALNDDELIQLMECFGFKFDTFSFEKVVFCSSILKWTGTTSAGFDRLHFARPENEATQFGFADGWKDKSRRRQILRAHWEEVDPHRIAAVDEELKS
ncbi:retron St85 family effector protein [Novosphingobium sp. 1949]|uniref:Retron St85 family effector protein n=1 Tax=Novosphingobium organovorum TaxID=2930092 RepID=A0ABT0BHZ4_9SPHN|nr:retron St85 family effector protein [Novosphingobium organovorum]MCJ2184545.1 retron St85 family effector protein [Novosphingobium organovorum]